MGWISLTILSRSYCNVIVIGGGSLYIAIIFLNNWRKPPFLLTFLTLSRLSAVCSTGVVLCFFAPLVDSQSKPQFNRRLSSQMLDGLRRRHASRPSSRPLSLNFSTFSAPPPSPDMEGGSDHPIRRWGGKRLGTSAPSHPGHLQVERFS